jgi:hypothetical protein
MLNKVFQKIVLLFMSKNMAEPVGPHMAKWWRVAFWISKAIRAQEHASAIAPTPTHAHTHTHTYVNM